MFIFKRFLVSTCASAVFGAALFSAPPDEPKTAAPDNTAVNKAPGKTADNQKETAQDRKISQQIRKSLTNDKSLSTYAHNVKIIAIDGIVTLRGPVRSEDEVKLIESRAKEVAGVTSVVNELAVAAKVPEKSDKLKTSE